MKVYIISNYVKIKNTIFNIINKDDIVVFCNNAKWDIKQFDNNNKILFIRGNGKGYWGYKPTFNNRYTTTYLIGGKINVYNNFKDKKEQITSEFTKTIDYPTNYHHTTGYIAYHYMKHLYPELEIILIGFTGRGSDGGSGWHKHNFNFEQKYYKENNVTIL